MQYKNLTIIGTSHISRKSVNQVKLAINDDNPEIIAIELDRNRLHSLLSKQKNKFSIKAILKIGIKGYMFSLLGAWAEKKLGKLTGVSPGEEMITAAKLAKKHKIPLALIDQNIEITLKEFSKALTWKEKWNFLMDLIKSAFGKKEKIEFDLNSVPEEKIINNLMNKVKKRYPSIYKVLIKDRNKVLAINLFNLMKKEKKIIAVMGAGHCKEVISLIKDMEVFSLSQQIKNNKN